MNGYWSSIFQQVLVNIFSQNIVIIEVASWRLPNTIDYMLVIKLLKNSITSKNNEIIVISYLKAFDIWCCNHTHRVSSIPHIFSFNISQSPWNWETAWENSMRTNYHLNTGSVIRRGIWNVAFILIYLTSIFFNSFCFSWVLWFVILR